MAVNKVIYNGKTLMDVTSNTVTAETLSAGVTATAADGTTITGTMKVVDYTLSMSEPTSADGSDGAIWFVYEE